MVPGGVGRYTQADAIGLRGGVNVYEYADADPLDEIDPYGLTGCPADVVGFINKMCQVAKTAAGDDCPCRAMLVQSGFESGWGTGPTVPNNNYFGLHGEGNNGFRLSQPKDPKVKPVKLPKNKTPLDSYKQFCGR